MKGSHEGCCCQKKNHTAGHKPNSGDCSHRDVDGNCCGDETRCGDEHAVDGGGCCGHRNTAETGKTE